MTSREVRLAARPRGAPKESDFELAEVEVPQIGAGELLIRNAFMSVDPYMRGRMNDVKSYVPPFAVGEAMTGGAVGRVVASRNDAYAEGDWVTSMLGWREVAVSDGRGLQKIDVSYGPPSAFLGVLGIPGMTAYVGLLDIGQAKAGETVFVSAAAGAVGSAVGQIAKLKGCRVIGSAGSDEKVGWLGELGFDVAFNYKSTPPRDALRDEPIDVYFDNVGGDQLEAAISALKPFGRIVACGMISRYNDERPEPGPSNIAMVIGKRLRMEGFIVSDRLDRLSDFVRDVSTWIREGKLRYRETVLDGIDRAPEAFLGLLGGENVGKMLVRVGPDA